MSKVFVIIQRQSFVEVLVIWSIWTAMYMNVKLLKEGEILHLDMSNWSVNERVCIYVERLSYNVFNKQYCIPIVTLDLM